MKFKVDENLPEELAALLRNAGWDAVSVDDENLGGAMDPRVAAACDVEDRVLVSFDVGFADITRYPPREHPGYIVFRLRQQDKPYVLRVAARLVFALRNREIRHELWVVEDDRIRIRTA